MSAIFIVFLLSFLIIPVVFPQDNTGVALYKKNCAICHGDDLKGKPALAGMLKIEPERLDLTTDDVQNDTDEELLKVINDGIEKMPAYKDKLTQEEQKDILKYIRDTSNSAKPLSPNQP